MGAAWLCLPLRVCPALASLLLSTMALRGRLARPRLRAEGGTSSCTTTELGNGR